MSFKSISVCALLLLLLSSCKIPYTEICKRNYTNTPLKELKVNESDTVCIEAINPRNRTGILLVKDAEYKMEVIPGTQRWKDGWLVPFTAKGRISPHFTVLHLFKRKIFAKWFSLIGSVENKRSTYFKIGVKRNSYRSTREGELICFANDVWGDYWYCHNNKGVLTLIVTRIK